MGKPELLVATIDTGLDYTHPAIPSTPALDFIITGLRSTACSPGLEASDPEALPGPLGSAEEGESS